MPAYRSEEVTLRRSAESLYDQLSDLGKIRDLLSGAPLDALGEEDAARLAEVEVSEDSITLPAGPVGKVTLKVTEKRAPELIHLEGIGTPVPLFLELRITPVSAGECRAQALIDIKVPLMLKPLINGPLQKMVNQFAELLPRLPQA